MSFELQEVFVAAGESMRTFGGGKLMIGFGFVFIFSSIWNVFFVLVVDAGIWGSRVYGWERQLGSTVGVGNRRRREWRG